MGTNIDTNTPCYYTPWLIADKKFMISGVDKNGVKPLSKTDYDNSDTIIQAEVEICYSKWY